MPTDNGTLSRAPEGVAETSTEPATRVNVMLSREVLEWLDAQTEHLRQNAGADVNRSALVRAIVGAFADNKLRFSGVRDEKAIRTGLSRWLQSRGAK